MVSIFNLNIVIIKGIYICVFFFYLFYNIYYIMSNYVVPGPNGGMPSIQYIQHLRDAGILSQQIANNQINYINLYNQNKNIYIQRRADIIKKMIEKQANTKLNKSNTSNNSNKENNKE